MQLILIKVFVFLFGLAFGSFLNVIIYRLPKEGLSIGQPRRSLCPKCETHLDWYDNLPLVSYLLLRGRCRHCSTKISPRYPLVELMCGLLTLAVFYRTGLGQGGLAFLHDPGVAFRTLAQLYFVLALVAITFIDLDHGIIPDALTVPGMILGLATAAIVPDLNFIGLWLGQKLWALGLHNFRLLSFLGSLFGLLLGYGIIWGIFQIYYLLRKVEGIGGGDATLLAMVGASLGWRSIWVTIFFGSILGLVGMLAFAKKDEEFGLQSSIPFGPFLAMAALFYMFFGEDFLRWYLG